MYHYGAEWKGADITENQITYARMLSEEAGMDIEYVVSVAEDIEFPDKTFDVVTACQYFEISEWEKEHMAYMQTLPETFDILHYVSIIDVQKKEET